jgi:hypothetical protein
MMTIIEKSMMMRNTIAFHRCDQTTMTMSSCITRVIVVWSHRNKKMMTNMVSTLVFITGAS